MNRSRVVCCPGCGYALARIGGVEGQKAVQVDPAPPSAPDCSAGGVVVADAPTPTTGRRPDATEDHAAALEWASRRIESLTAEVARLRKALDEAYHG